MSFDDLKNVDWGETIKLLVARGFASALVIVLVLALFAPQGLSWAGAIGFILLWTAGGALVVIAATFLLRGVNWILRALELPFGLVIWFAFLIPYWILAAAVVVGDPLVWLFMRIVPGVLNIQGFKAFNWVTLYFVMRGGPSIDLGFSLPVSWRRGGGLY
jgi:hypothetical protein